MAAFLGQHRHLRRALLQQLQHSRFGRQIRFRDQITGAPFAAHLAQIAPVAAQLGCTGIGGRTGNRQQLLIGWAHSSSRGMAERTVPWPKALPNCSMYTSSSSWVSTVTGP